MKLPLHKGVSRYLLNIDNRLKRDLAQVKYRSQQKAITENLRLAGDGAAAQTPGKTQAHIMNARAIIVRILTSNNGGNHARLAHSRCESALQRNA